MLALSAREDAIFYKCSRQFPVEHGSQETVVMRAAGEIVIGDDLCLAKGFYLDGSQWATDFDVMDPGYIKDPAPVWRELRDKCPIAHTTRFRGELDDAAAEEGEGEGES